MIKSILNQLESNKEYTYFEIMAFVKSILKTKVNPKLLSTELTNSNFVRTINLNNNLVWIRK